MEKFRFDLQRFATGSLQNTSTSQSVTYEAEGEKDDYSPIITNIDPEHNMFMSQFPVEANATQLKFDWLAENLKPPARNAHLEMEDYATGKVGGMERRENTVQFFHVCVRSFLFFPFFNYLRDFPPHSHMNFS